MSPSIEEKLVEHIKEKYNPLSIVLHGSRANGSAREHSDWDFLIITEKDMNTHGELLEGSKIDYHQLIHPIPEGKGLSFMYRPENVKILFDTNDIAKEFIMNSDEFVTKGNQFTEVERKSRHAFLTSALNGIQDYGDNSLIMFDKKIDFYTRALPSWFRFLKKEYMPSGYIAFPRIEKEDIEFHSLIQQFVCENDSVELVKIGNKILIILFPDLM